MRTFYRKLAFCTFLVAATLLCIFPVQAQPAKSSSLEAARSSTLTVAQYQAELDRWIESVKELELDSGRAAELRARVPDAWLVSDGQLQFTVPTETLTAQLELLGSKPGQSRKALATLRGWLQALHREAAGYAAPPVSRSQDPSEKLREILSRREFRGIGEPGFLELLSKRLQLQLFRLLEWLFGRIGNTGIGDYLVWILIGLLIILLVWMFVRTLRNAAAIEPTQVERAGVPVQSWRQWIAQAEKLAAAGDFRGAVHASYWAGVVWLEERGAFSADRARTPRECIRLLPTNDPRRAALRGITEHMETTWYGYRAATHADFVDARARLEELGCPLHASPAIAAS